MKQAKVEADEEIKVFRAQLEKEVSDMASAVRWIGILSLPPLFSAHPLFFFLSPWSVTNAFKVICDLVFGQ